MKPTRIAILHVRSPILRQVRACLISWGVMLSLLVVLSLEGSSQVEVSSEVQKLEQQRIEVIAKASQASVCVFGAGGQGGGSGVVVTSDGFALTNFHVVQGNGPFMQCSMPDGKLYDSVLVGIDPTGDVALIKLLGRDDFPFARIGDSDELRVGQWCFAVGNPFLLATNFEPSISWGLVSGIHRYQYPAGSLLEYADCIQTDAAINPGNSGGALFNANGELVGINGRGSFEKRGRVNVGVGYAISINQIKMFFSHLKSGRLVDHATLGATVATNEAGEVRVSNIVESSDAFLKGVRYDDQVASIAGREVRTVNQFKNILGIFPKGWRVPIGVKRDGEQLEFMVRLAGVHSEQQLVELIQGAIDTKPQPVPVPEKPESEESKSEAAKYELQDKSYAKLYKARRGYANFYFNKLESARVWEAFQQNGDFKNASRKWRVSLVINGERATLILDDKTSGLQSDSNTFLLDFENEPASQLDPPKTGGLLLSLHLWRKFLREGFAGIGDVTYVGLLPYFGPRANGVAAYPGNELAESLSSTLETIETNWLFDGETGTLLSMEMFPDVDVQPCVVHFRDYQVHDDLTVPGELVVEHSNFEPTKIVVEQIEFIESQPGGEQ